MFSIPPPIQPSHLSPPPQAEMTIKCHETTTDADDAVVISVGTGSCCSPSPEQEPPPALCPVPQRVPHLQWPQHGNSIAASTACVTFGSTQTTRATTTTISSDAEKSHDLKPQCC